MYFATESVFQSPCPTAASSEVIRARFRQPTGDDTVLRTGHHQICIYRGILGQELLLQIDGYFPILSSQLFGGPPNSSWAEANYSTVV